MASKPRQIAYIILTIFYFIVLLKYTQNREFSWFMDNFTLLIHEGGHMFFGFFGELIGVMGGTIFQIIIPASTSLVFLKQRDYYAISFSIFWLGTSMFNIGRYVADAQQQILPLVSMGTGEPIHDWNFMLNHFGLLSQTQDVANVFYAFGYILLACAIVYGSYINLLFIKTRRYNTNVSS
jgi:hypothetical protein